MTVVTKLALKQVNSSAPVTAVSTQISAVQRPPDCFFGRISATAISAPRAGGRGPALVPAALRDGGPFGIASSVADRCVEYRNVPSWPVLGSEFEKYYVQI